MKQIHTLGVPALFLFLGACMTPSGSDRGAQVLGGSDDPAVDDDGDDSVDQPDDGDDDSCTCAGEADLPYNVNLPLGSSFKLTDAFLLKGPLPAAVLELTMEAPEWRLPELLANTTYVVTQADCDHEGNHGTGRDRLNITWQNGDGSTESDHFTIRYCEDADEPDPSDQADPCDCGEGGGGTGEGGAAPPPSGTGGSAPEPQ
jgi:hypothetical protein